MKPDLRTGTDECACVPPSPQPGCVGDRSTPEQRSAALRDALAAEAEPLVVLTHLLRLCRDEHPVLWERMNDPLCRAHVTCVQADLSEVLPAPGTKWTLEPDLRDAMAAALVSAEDVPVVVVARALAELLDTHFGHTFVSSFAARSPYQPRVGDPVPLDGYDLRRVTDLATTSPPWRLANRLDETRRVRLAGEWAAQFRIVFDYCLADVLAGLVDRDTIVATCHPNRSLAEFSLPRDEQGRSFPVQPRDVARQRVAIDRLIGAAVDAGASVVVLPELSVTESMAMELEHWVRRPRGLRLLVAGSFHTQAAAADATESAVSDPPGARRRNRALAWVRGSARPLLHEKHSPADRPIREDIRPQGWPDIRIHVTADGWHLVLAVCRDLLNPHAVHALSEAGANLVLVPAMSETLMAFGGPVAQLVGAEQAVVAVANNPAQWSDPGDPVIRTAPHALLGHPGFARQTRSVATAGPGAGVALLKVRSGEVTWLPDDDGSTALGQGRHPADVGVSKPPPWVEQLSRHADRWATEAPRSAAVTLRTAAVLVLLTDGSAGPAVLLTERSPDLSHYPGQLVFPGGMSEGGDDGPVATALREAREEVGLGPTDIHVIGPLHPLALPDSGFLVTPVLAWSSAAGALEDVNPAEVRTLIRAPVSDWRRAVEEALASAGYADREPPACGPMTETVLDLLASMLSQD